MPVGIAVLFPGQGTQVPGMGEVWRASPAWDVVVRAESALGQPLAHLLLDAGADELARTRDAQLAVLLTSLMAWEAVRDALDEAPVAFAGHSLGQITALIASGVVPSRTASAWPPSGPTAPRPRPTPAPDAWPPSSAPTSTRPRPPSAGATSAGRTCWVANDNAPGQVVIGGTPSGVEAAAARARDLGVKRVMPLKVGAAFHTPLMAPAAAHLLDHLADTPFAAPVGPRGRQHRRRRPPRRRRVARAVEPSSGVTSTLEGISGDSRRPRCTNISRSRTR